jgi:hypothetical protein
MNGFASGEAIVAKLGGYLKAEGEDVEKRAFIIEPEFARLLTVNSRDGSTASPILRGAWDSGRLQHVRAKQNLLADDAHLSLLAHITPDELRARMTSTDISGGFANRVLFACVRRARKIPIPKPLSHSVVGALAKRLRAAIDFAREDRVMTFSREAEEVWCEFYDDEPEREGVVGEMTERSRVQRLRLSVAYALLDHSASIEPNHVLAAEALWRYCAASVEHLFGGLCGDRVQDQLLKALREAHPDGLTGAQQHALFNGKERAERLEAARQILERRGVIENRRESTGGRDRIVSFALRRITEKIRIKDGGELFIRLSSPIQHLEMGDDAARAAADDDDAEEEDRLVRASNHEPGEPLVQPCSFHTGPATTECQRCGATFREHLR